MNFGVLLALFVITPITELLLLMKVSELLGFGSTIGLVILTGVVGASLARYQGLQVLLNIQRDLASGRMPAPYLLDGLMILVAGALLVTPGLITDVVGFGLLVPTFRQGIKGWLRGMLEKKLRKGTASVTYWKW